MTFWGYAGQAATVVTAVVILRQIIIWGRKPNRPAPESQESEQDRLREEAAHAPQSPVGISHHARYDEDPEAFMLDHPLLLDHTRDIA